MFTVQEIELLAGLLQRAPVSGIEVIWINGLLERLRQVALSQGAGSAAKTETSETLKPETPKTYTHPTLESPPEMAK